MVPPGLTLAALFSLVAFATPLAFVTPLAFAAPPAPDAAALLRRGTELYKAGVYDKAAQAFEGAWQLAPTPTTALNLAQSLEGAGRPANALTWYDRVLETEPSGPRHDAAFAGRAHLRQHGYVAVTCGPPGAALTVGPAQGQCPVWGGYLPAGEHAVSLTAEGRAPHRGSVTLVGGQRAELTLELPQQIAVILPAPDAPDAPDAGLATPLPADAHAAAETDTADPEPAVPAWVGYTLLGLGGAGLIVGGLYYAEAADDAEQADGLTSGARRDRIEKDFERHQLFAYSGLGVGGALLLAGGATLVFGGTF